MRANVEWFANQHPDKKSALTQALPTAADPPYHADDSSKSGFISFPRFISFQHDSESGHELILAAAGASGRAARAGHVEA